MSESNTELVSHLGVFWDIENCPIPGGRIASNVVNSIRHFISNKYSNCTECTFCCSCDTRRLDERIVEGLNRSGVDILHVNTNRVPYKVDADSKLKEGIEKFVDHHNHRSTLIVITGDIDFAPAIRSAKRNGIQVILIYGQNASQDLRNFATESHPLYDIINSVERDSSFGSNVRTPPTNNNNVVTTSRLPLIGRNNSSSTATPTAQLINFDDWDSKPPQAVQQIPFKPSFTSITSNSSQLTQRTSQSPQNPETSSRQSTRSTHEVNRSQQELQTIRLNIPQSNDSNTQQLSPESTAKLQTIQSITGVDRHVAIRLLQVYKGNVELAINSIYSD